MEKNKVMREQAPFFLAMAFLYSICFAIAFYRNYNSITFPLITAATLAVCILFLKKNKIPWKKSNWWYLAGCMILGISTFLTENLFIIFFNYRKVNRFCLKIYSVIFCPDKIRLISAFT